MVTFILFLRMVYEKSASAFKKNIRITALVVSTLSKRLASRIRAFFAGDKNRAQVMAHQSSRNTRKNHFLIKKPIIVGAGAIVLVTAAILSFALPALGSSEDIPDDETAYALGADIVQFIKDEPIQSEGEPSSSPSSALSVSEMTNYDEPAPTTPPSPAAVQTTAPEIIDLVRGCHDPRVVDIQEKLMELGYMASDEPSDYYGYTTWYSLQLFQRKHGLGVDGIAGDNTLVMLFSDDAKPYTVKLGDSGSDIEEFQDRLKSLKYLSTRATGYFGTDTEKAVKKFQERNGLYADGNIGEQTLSILNSDSAREAPSSSGGGGSSGGGDSGGGGGSDNKPPVQVYIDGDPTPDKLIEFAQTKLGCDYSLGAKGPNSFDCSGFVYYCLNQIGYKINYMTSSTWKKLQSTDHIQHV